MCLPNVCIALEMIQSLEKHNTDLQNGEAMSVLHTEHGAVTYGIGPQLIEQIDGCLSDSFLLMKQTICQIE